MKMKFRKTKESIQFYEDCECFKNPMKLCMHNNLQVKINLWKAIIKQLKKELK